MTFRYVSRQVFFFISCEQLATAFDALCKYSWHRSNTVVLYTLLYTRTVFTCQRMIAFTTIWSVSYLLHCSWFDLVRNHDVFAFCVHAI